MAVFENPNSPQQPHKGIYVWYATKGNSKITIYVGRAGFQKTCLPKGTLFRGISELQRCIFTSNSPGYNILDTDFIVGTAIRYFEDKRGYQCYWKHIDDDPRNERKFVLEEKPILQDNTGLTQMDSMPIQLLVSNCVSPVLIIRKLFTDLTMS